MFAYNSTPCAKQKHRNLNPNPSVPLFTFLLQTHTFQNLILIILLVHFLDEFNLNHFSRECMHKRKRIPRKPHVWIKIPRSISSFSQCQTYYLLPRHHLQLIYSHLFFFFLSFSCLSSVKESLKVKYFHIILWIEEINVERIRRDHMLEIMSMYKLLCVKHI